MSIPLFGLGLFILLFTVVDLVWTTLTLKGAGPVTRLLGGCIWGCFSILHGKLGHFHAGLAQTGWMLLVATASVWVGLTWTGWVLVFGSDPTAVVNGVTREPADLAALIYFCGFATYTLGVGDFVPNGDLWQVLTPVATIQGFVLITLSITYVIQVLSAGVGDRTAARLIHSLGGEPRNILQSAWNGEDFSSLSHALSGIGQLLAGHSEQHAAYPVLRYFHQEDKRVALPLQAAILGEALAQIELLCGKDHGINAVALGGVNAGIDGVWEVLPKSLRIEPGEAPPVPDRDRLWLPSEVPVPPVEEMARWGERMAEHRRRLWAIALSDRWRWSDVDRAAG